MHRPSISIVTPSLNQGPFLLAAIRSVLGQGYDQVEYVVMDGGSTDESRAIAGQFADRLTLVCDADGGQSDAINKGLARNSGEIVAWLNADDYYADGTFGRVAAAFEAWPDCVMVYGNAALVDRRGERLGMAEQIEPFSLDRLLDSGNFIVQPAAFFRRSAFEAIGGVRTDLNWSMDYDLWIRLGKLGRVRHIPETFAFVRCHPNTKTASGGWQRIREVEDMIRGHGGSGLPVLFRLEAAALEAREALALARKLALPSALRAAARGFAWALTSPRTLASLTSPRTWRIIRAARRRNAHLAALG